MLQKKNIAKIVVDHLKNEKEGASSAQLSLYSNRLTVSPQVNEKVHFGNVHFWVWTFSPLKPTHPQKLKYFQI